MGKLSHCVSCGRKLRDAFFCSHCQQAACCWRCLDRHLACHEAAQEEAEATPDIEVESRPPPAPETPRMHPQPLFGLS